jgi:hypothetical protein
MDKTDRIVEELQARGFAMMRNEFLRTRLYKILEEYDINEPLTREEYLLLVGKLYMKCQIE